MRKWICLFFLVFVIGWVMPQVSVAENADAYGYSTILSEYRQAVLNAREENDGWLYYRFDWEPLSMVTVNASLGLVGTVQDQFGYAFHDLNADNQPELFLMLVEYQYDFLTERWVDMGNPDYAILAICSLANDKTPVWCWVGGYGDDGIGNDICYLNADNTLTIVIPDAIEEYVETYRLGSSGNEWIPLDKLGWDFSENYDTMFYQRSGDGEKISISEDAYRNSPLWPTDYSRKHGSLVYIPLFN